MRSTCCERAYQEGVKEGLRQALREMKPKFDPFQKIGGPDAPYKQTRKWKERNNIRD